MISSAAGAISLGTYSGGWRIMRTLGRRIIHLDPPRAFAAESAGAAVLYATAFVFQAPGLDDPRHHLGDHGRRRDPPPLRRALGVASNIVAAWVLTFPMAALVAWVCYEALHLLIR